MPRTHRPSPPEFRAEAVCLARGSDTSIPALPANLSVSSEVLRHWLRQDDADAGRGQPGEPTTDEREALRRLRRVRTTVADPTRTPGPNLFTRDFTAPAADRLWIGDITFVPTGEG